MLIGAHVSPAGGPAKAVERGAEQGARAIQIFNQNPRAWKPTVYADDQIEAFHDAIASSKVEALLIHAVYLLNPASDEREFRDKTLASLIASLQAGDRLGAHAVVLHPGSAKAGDVGKAIKRALAMTFPARSMAFPTSPAFADPGCRTTAWAPSRSPACSEAIREASVLSRNSRSSEAGLRR